MAEMGRPCIFDEEKERQLSEVCRMKPTLKDAAAILGCSPSGIEKFIRKKYNQTFSEFREERMALTRHALVQKAIQMATSGDRVMLIFCLKNLNKWQDKVEEIKEDERTVNVYLK